jgi:hypothetical protein
MPRLLAFRSLLSCSFLLAVLGSLAWAQEPHPESPSEALPAPDAPGAPNSTGDQAAPAPPPSSDATLPAVPAPTPMPAVPPPVPGEDGFVGVHGKVTDADGFALMAALVQVVEHGSTSVHADEAGSFMLPLLPGTYTLQVSFPMYETRRVTVTVAPGQATELALALSPSQEGAEVIEIVGTIDRGSEGAQLELRRSAAVVSDVLSVDGRRKARRSGEERASGPNIFTGCSARKLPVRMPLA